jgi:hypothetical protein
MSASDGIANGSLGFLPNPKAPEMQVPEFHGEDTSWYNDGSTGPVVKGMQPITSTNPNGDYAGVSPMSPACLA